MIRCHSDSREKQILNFVFVLAVGLIAGTISGIVGTGSSIMLVPVLVYEFGPKEAVPIMAVAAVMANLSRILAWWREVDWRACAAYSITGIPAAALGARTLLVLPSRAVDIAIGVFLIAMVPARHWLARHDIKLSLLATCVWRRSDRLSHRHCGLDRATSVPLFLFYGLAKGLPRHRGREFARPHPSKLLPSSASGALTPEIAERADCGIPADGRGLSPPALCRSRKCSFRLLRRLSIMERLVKCLTHRNCGRALTWHRVGGIRRQRN